jgi:predicted transcriptional regulator
MPTKAKAFTVYLDDNTTAWLETYCKREDRSASWAIAFAVKQLWAAENTAATKQDTKQIDLVDTINSARPTTASPYTAHEKIMQTARKQAAAVKAGKRK